MRRSLLCLFVLGLPALAHAQEGPAKPPEAPPGPVSGALDTGGHATPIQDLAFTPDGQKLISVDRWDVYVWDTLTGERERSWRLPTPLEKVAVAPDGKRVAVAAQVGEWEGKKSPRFAPLWLLDLETGRARLIRTPIGYGVLCLAFAPDGQRLAWGTWYEAGVWDLKANRATHLLDRFGGTVLEVAFDGDGKRLLTSGSPVGKSGPVAQVWDVSPPAGAKRPVKPEGPLYTLAGAGHRVVWAPDGSRFADWQKKKAGTISFWAPDGKRERAADGQAPRTVTLPHDAEPSRLQFLDPDRLAVVAPVGRGIEASLVNVRTGKVELHRQWPLNEEWEHRTAVSADGKLLAATRFPGNQVVLFDLEGTTKRRSLGRAYPTPWCAAWGPDGHTIAWGFTPHTWGLTRGLDLATLEPRDGKQVQGFSGAWKPKGWEVVHEAADRRARKTRGLTLIHDGKRLETDLDSPPEFFTFYKGPEGKLGVVVIRAWGDGDLELLDAETGKRTLVAWATRGVWAAVSPDGRYLLLARHDLTLEVFRIDGKPALLLKVLVARQDWAAWTPGGYYAATPGGERMMGWTSRTDYATPLTFYPAERFGKQLYRPDVIQQVLEKGSVREAVKAANAALQQAGGPAAGPADLEELLPPRAYIKHVEQEGPKLKVTATAEKGNKGQPVRSLRLLVDGRPLPDGQGVLDLKAAKEKAEADWEVELPPGPHELKALARGPDTAGASEAVAVDVPAAADRPTLHVIAVGIDDYPREALRLKCAVADAQGLADAFRKHCAGKDNLFGAAKVTLLPNDKATRPAILAALKEAHEAVKPGDLLVFSFAGHGARQGKQFYLLTYDADPDKPDQTALSGDDLRSALADLPCQVLLLLDACHSAAGVGAFIDQAARGLTGDETGVAVLCAAMGYEEAQEKDGHGLFTGAVIEALEKSDGVPFNRHDRRQYVHHLGAFVQDEVKEESADAQHPFLALPYVTESFPVRLLPKKQPRGGG